MTHLNEGDPGVCEFGPIVGPEETLRKWEETQAAWEEANRLGDPEAPNILAQLAEVGRTFPPDDWHNPDARFYRLRPVSKQY